MTSSSRWRYKQQNIPEKGYHGWSRFTKRLPYGDTPFVNDPIAFRPSRRPDVVY